MAKDKMNFVDRAVAWVAPIAGIRRMQARKHLEKFQYEAARFNRERRQATAQTDNRNGSQYERDRVQIMRNARDLEENHPIVGSLHTKYSLNVAPVSYQAQTGDKTLDKDIEDAWREDISVNCDLLERYSFYELASFAVSGTIRDGDHGWIYVRDGVASDMKDGDKIKLPLKIKAIEADLIGNPNMTATSANFISGLVLDEVGRIISYEIYKREIGTSAYMKDMDVAPMNFVHFMDNLRVVDYRGYSKLASGENTLRDLKETLDALRMAAKKHASITSFITGSQGAEIGVGEFDPYRDTAQTQGGPRYYENSVPGKNYYLNEGEAATFPDSPVPSTQTQYLIDYLSQLVSFCYNLPVSFSLDATKLGGVSMRLESMQALAEFKRARGRFSPRFTKAKNALLLDYRARPNSPFAKVDPKMLVRGTWGFVQHPTPDIGKEASALQTRLNLNQADPLAELMDQGLDPETTAYNICKWQKIQEDAAATVGVDYERAFTPAKPSEIADIKSSEADQVKAQAEVDKAKQKPE